MNDAGTGGGVRWAAAGDPVSAGEMLGKNYGFLHCTASMLRLLCEPPHRNPGARRAAARRACLIPGGAMRLLM